MRGPRVGECIVLLPLATPGWCSGAEPGRASVPLITHVTHRRRRQGRVCTDGEMRGWIPTVECNGGAHRMVWLSGWARVLISPVSTER